MSMDSIQSGWAREQYGRERPVRLRYAGGQKSSVVLERNCGSDWMCTLDTVSYKRERCDSNMRKSYANLANMFASYSDVISDCRWTAADNMMTLQHSINNFTNRVSTGGNAIASVHLSICFHSNFQTMSFLLLPRFHFGLITSAAACAFKTVR